MGIYTKDEQFKLINEDLENLKLIDNQYEEVCLEAVKQTGLALMYIKVQTPEICLDAVKQNGGTLRYVKEQTPEICLEAIKQSSGALQYIKEQTYELCLEAVKKDGRALGYVEEQTPEVCLELIKYSSGLIKDVKNKTPKLCFYAFINDYDLLTYKYIKTGIEKYIKSSSIKNKVFCRKSIGKFKNADFYFDNRSLIYLKDYLFSENCINNKYMLNDKTDINLLKEIALSNNELIIIDTGNIQDIHKILANKIIREEDL